MNALDWLNAQIFGLVNALAVLVPIAAGIVARRWATARRWPRPASYAAGAAGVVAALSVGVFTARWVGIPSWLAGFGY